MMTHSELHREMKSIMKSKMRIREYHHKKNAHFLDDFHMNSREVNLLLYYVEDHFNIKLKRGIENQLNNMNQLVSLIYREKHNSFSAN